MQARTYETRTGIRYPLGATPFPDGVNFSVFSRNATAVELLLYEHADSPSPFQCITLDPEVHRTFFAWHVFVVKLPAGTHYTWRVDGPGDTARTGFRFDRSNELLDPYAVAVSDSLWDRPSAITGSRRPHRSMRGVVVRDEYDWEGDEPLNHAPEDAVIYELHVGGFTRHHTSGVSDPGTFAGVIEKIPYLKQLGVTDIELMPVMAFDLQDVPAGVSESGLRNFWGYSTHSFFSPHPGYCVARSPVEHRREFRDMVKALHRAGIGVFMDVVFNHTAEGGADGPTINFKGLGNEFAYHLDPKDRRRYRDYTGCGNTVNCNHPFMARFIVDNLEYWVHEMHVDGFRFDLASVLARGADGEPMYHATAPWSIEFSDTLAHTRIIAEAWDAGGLYQVGDFPGFRWAEWNGRYRDVMRRFVRGDPGLISELATRLTGSSDLYESAGRLPINSVNFITCHDGFTLNDLVSYDRKHNEANGEDNRDGYDDNLSWNCGVEGETDAADILGLRGRQAKNFLAILLLSHGVPMILAGDEVLRTQRGNNNVWCQDNELGWFDWSLGHTNAEMLRFTKTMIAFRMRHACLRRRRFVTGKRVTPEGLPDVAWHGWKLNEPPWDNPEARLLAYTLAGLCEGEAHLHIVLNMQDEPVRMTLPEVSGRRWFRAVDTALASPEDILEQPQQPRLASHYMAPARSVVVLESR